MKVIQKISINKLTVLFILILSITFVHVYINNTVSLTHAEAEVLDDNASSAFTLSSDRSLTVSVSSANIDLTLTPTAEGIFNSTSETPLTITVSTNNATGYNLNMATTTTDLTRTASLSGHYPVINTLSGSGSFTSETFEDNAWGYSLDGDNFTAMKLAAQINQTTKESNSSATNIIFGAKLNNEIPHGSYRSTITFIATTNPLDATFDTAFDVAGKTQVSYNGNNYYKMQDMSGFICNMVATPTDKTSAESTQLIDIRDNNIYWVSKLLDGRCWMTQNLDLNLDSTVALTSEDSDLHSVTSWTPSHTTIDSTNYGTIVPCSSYDDADTGCWGQANASFAPGWDSSSTEPRSADPGKRYMYPTPADASIGAYPYFWSLQDKTYNSLAECQSSNADCNEHNSYGNYYNFAAATANNNLAASTPYETMPDSICPAGWKLPQITTNLNEFDELYSKYHASGAHTTLLNKIRYNPLYMMRLGDIRRENGDLWNSGVVAEYYSGNNQDNNTATFFQFDSTKHYASFIHPAQLGLPVRCIARTDQTIEDAVYLQDVTPEMRQNTSIGATATVKDSRDGEEYIIGKLADGNIWLLDNLRLDLVTANLTADNTNAPADALNLLKHGGATSTTGYTTTAVSHIGSSNTSHAEAPMISVAYAKETNGDDRKFGIYYNFCATSAGTYCVAQDLGDAKYDICPAGWRLPLAQADNNESEKLYNQYASYSAWFDALRLTYSASINYDGSFMEYADGYFRSSTPATGYSATTLYKTRFSEDRGANFTNTNGSKTILYSIRCILK